MKIYIADDSSEIRDRIKLLIENINEVEISGESGSASDAYDAIKLILPDLVITDLSMPGNGVNLLKALKEEQLVRTVIVLTNFPFDQLREKCIKLGADYFLNKANEFEKIPGILMNLTKKSKQYDT